MIFHKTSPNQSRRLSSTLSYCYLFILLTFISLFSLAHAESASANAALAPNYAVHSLKKGIGLMPIKNKDWQQRLASLNVAWFYTWRPEHPSPSGVSENIEFVPMVWGQSAMSQETLNNLKNGKSEGRYKHLLTFNEPDAKSQSNIPVIEATKSWSELAAINLRLGSPVTVNANNPWMKKFVSTIENQNAPLDFIAVHWYGGANPDKFLKYLERVHNLYHRPIWITEFAVADWAAKKRGFSHFSSNQAVNFMKVVLPALEQLDYVERYAWFSPATENPALSQSALFDNAGQLTPLGKIYAEY